MTSTSFGTQTPGLPQSLLAPPCETRAQCPRFDAQHQGVAREGGAEVQRAKGFSAQYTFKAPAADDFAKGMLAHRATATPGSDVSTTAGTTVGLINVIKAMLGVSKSVALPPQKPD